MEITVTDNATNEIITDRTIAPERLSVYEVAGQTVHRGRYSKNRYDYDGTEFVEKVDAEEQTQFDMSQESVMAIVLDQLRWAGVEIPIHFEQVVNKEQAKRLIDQASDRAKRRYISPGFLTVEEYQQALAQAQEYMADNSTVPPMTQTWADVLEDTPLAAAQNVLATREQWKQVLNVTYDLRLKGKKAVDNSGSDYREVMKNYVNLLDNV